MEGQTFVVFIWTALSLTLLTLEVAAAPGVGFLYAGLSALMTAAAVGFGLLPAGELMQQLACFTVGTALWAALLWLPMKRMLRKPSGGYSDLIGARAEICGAPLSRGKTGQAKWSGTYMNAVIDPRDASESFAEGAQVVIAKAEGNTLYVAAPDAEFLRTGGK